MDTPIEGGFGQIWAPRGPRGPKGPHGAPIGPPWAPMGAQGALFTGDFPISLVSPGGSAPRSLGLGLSQHTLRYVGGWRPATPTTLPPEFTLPPNTPKIAIFSAGGISDQCKLPSRAPPSRAPGGPRGPLGPHGGPHGGPWGPMGPLGPLGAPWAPWGPNPAKSAPAGGVNFQKNHKN